VTNPPYRKDPFGKGTQALLEIIDHLEPHSIRHTERSGSVNSNAHIAAQVMIPDAVVAAVHCPEPAVGRVREHYLSLSAVVNRVLYVV
jgi:hypothetical protein